MTKFVTLMRTIEPGLNASSSRVPLTAAPSDLPTLGCDCDAPSTVGLVAPSASIEPSPLLSSSDSS